MDHRYWVCGYLHSFEMAFGKMTKLNENCKVDIFIKRRKCKHTVQITTNSVRIPWVCTFCKNTNYILIRKLNKFAFCRRQSKAIFSTRNFTLSPFATTLVQARSFQTINEPWRWWRCRFPKQEKQQIPEQTEKAEVGDPSVQQLL